MGYTMRTRCLECGGELYNDTEFGMIQCMDCDWHTTDDEEMHKVYVREREEIVHENDD